MYKCIDDCRGWYICLERVVFYFSKRVVSDYGLRLILTHMTNVYMYAKKFFIYLFYFLKFVQVQESRKSAI